MLAGLYQVIEQFFSKKSTNRFPVKHTPDSIITALQKGEINPPVDLPDHFRGRIAYDYDLCIGCGMCEKVCPAKALELYPVIYNEKKTKRVVFFQSRCTFCQECADVCPKDAIKLEKFFTMANYNRKGDDVTIGIEKRRENELKEETDPLPPGPDDTSGS